ncbi:MAG TPA: hypothetical protein PLS55_00520 [Thermogutta sp.]|nr:hypothetical protein [Thermogutta sp.]
MRRREFVRFMILAGSGLAGIAKLSTSAQAADWLNAELIKAALHTATPEEEGFVEYVVGLVQQGQLPAQILQSAYLWAQKRPKYKFQYFKRAIIYLAAQKGIRI